MSALNLAVPEEGPAWSPASPAFRAGKGTGDYPTFDQLLQAALLFYSPFLYPYRLQSSNSPSSQRGHLLTKNNSIGTSTQLVSTSTPNPALEGLGPQDDEGCKQNLTSSGGFSPPKSAWTNQGHLLHPVKEHLGLREMQSTKSIQRRGRSGLFWGRGASAKSY